jgi:hypothetical protein
VKVITHTVSLEKAKIATRAGADIIGHGIGDVYADAGWTDLMKQRGTGYMSTLAVYEPRHLRDPRSMFLQTLVDPDSYARIRHSSTPGEPARMKRWDALLKNVKAAKDAGVALGLGTDAGMAGAYHGWSTLRELELMVTAGFSPAEALAVGTSGSARLMGIADRGTIEEGKFADLVLCGGRPDERIQDIYRIERVWLGGTEQSREPVMNTGVTPLKKVEVAEVLDDFESEDGRSRISTLWLNRTDFSHDHSQMIYQRIGRETGGHALRVSSVMSDKEKPVAAMVLPLSKGGVLPANMAGYRFLEFEARGEGDYRFELERPGMDARMSPFSATPKWSKVKIGLADDAAMALVFIIERAAGEKAWLEIDNLRLVRR